MPFPFLESSSGFPLQESQKAPCDLDPCLPFWLYLLTFLPGVRGRQEEPLAVARGCSVFSILAVFAPSAPTWNNLHLSLAPAGQVESIPVSPSYIGTSLPTTYPIPLHSVTSVLVSPPCVSSLRQGSISSEPTTSGNMNIGRLSH